MKVSLFLQAVALASTATAELSWRGDQGRLVVRAPDGHEISPDAPASLTLVDSASERVLHAFGAELTAGAHVGPVRGRALDGSLSLQLCEKASGVCRPEELVFHADVPDAKKGAIALAFGAPAHAPAPTTGGFREDAASAADAAFATAKARGERVVLDFSAVWCPPCNLLAAEVLHAPDAAEALAGFQVAVLDVDHRSSWALKDRYAVGGYPTVIVTDADGTELDRVVGYDGREAFLAFLAGAGRPTPDTPVGLSADAAAIALWRRVRAGRPLDGWLEAAAESDLVEAHLARFRHAPGVDEATWLVAHAPERAIDWVPYAGAWGDTDAGRALRRDALRRALAHGGSSTADLLDLASDLAEGPARAELAAAAAAALRAGFTGDPARDRAGWTQLADLLDRAGETDAAVAFLDARTREHPEEPTFLLAAASLLNARGRHADALDRTKLALTRAWGDNALRVTHAHCTALVGLGRASEARGFAEKALAAEAAPEGLDVRTHRYRERLAAFLSP